MLTELRWPKNNHFEFSPIKNFPGPISRALSSKSLKILHSSKLNHKISLPENWSRNLGNCLLIFDQFLEVKSFESNSIKKVLTVNYFIVERFKGIISKYKNTNATFCILRIWNIPSVLETLYVFFNKNTSLEISKTLRNW